MLNYTKSRLTLASLLALGTAPAMAEGIADGFSKAIKQSDTTLSFRYRYESVDQDGLPQDADASTLLSRLTWKSGTVHGISGLVEVDNVSYLGDDDFNNTTNRKATYPIVADPDYTEINQALLSYVVNRSARIGVGRQRINHAGERFLGGVSWRQNEQTFDAARIEWKPVSRLTVDYSYIWNVNRVFDPNTDLGDFPGNTALGDFEGDTHALIATYDLGSGRTLAGYSYLLDIDELPHLSSSTFGLEYKGNTKVSEALTLAVNLAYARQEDYRDSQLNYSAPYYFAEVMGLMVPVNFAGGAAAPMPVSFGAGYEVMGSDDGVASFQTPLATLHKFDGFADKFLTTPPGGIEDAYLKAGITVAGVALTAFYHDFDSEDGGMHYGDEFDLVAAYAFSPRYGAQLKYASYNADEFATDTEKLWFMVTVTF